ncbi:GNAT family N-acetyltransferase [Pseudotenacibaculum sp. MALMAid0570]|uniref:GNAT family N-acetyltransferase n=1 Tax=Pseudotenacibaculum sp. MALMAid0570 TaxID=3143938 RepID=UPI0032E01609
MIKLRQATIEDLPVLLEFEQGMIIAERPMDVTLKREETYYYDLPLMIKDSNTELVVAEIEGEIVGTGYARDIKARECFAFERFSYLGFMFTKEEFRGKGVNKVIMDYLYDWSLARGIYEIRLEVYPSNPSAIKAYEKAGMDTSLLTMRIDLRDRK